MAHAAALRMILEHVQSIQLYAQGLHASGLCATRIGKADINGWAAPKGGRCAPCAPGTRGRAPAERLKTVLHFAENTVFPALSSLHVFPTEYAICV